ncbi:Hypothetical predicted protein [Pelobates cultripes]|uniref:Uncharacterized protein n=1 Tax=Pelobates cultripes TaxID=61616 RepID=A0AAD1WCR3_PELCU|nr:Hypothetical predicted protein [Pelobates cultripes]
MATAHSTDIYLIMKETEFRYDRMFRAIWKKLKALLRSPQAEASPGSKLQRPKRRGSEMDGTPPTLKTDAHRKGPGTLAPKRSKAVTRLRPHKTHTDKGTPKAPHQGQPRRKAATPRRSQRSKARPNGLRGRRRDKLKLAETATLPQQSGNGKRPHRSAQPTAGTSRHSPRKPVTLTAAPFLCTPGTRNKRLKCRAQACTMPTQGIG